MQIPDVLRVHLPQARRMKVINVPADGDCMFHAISYGLKRVRSARDLRKYVAASVTIAHPLRATAVDIWREGARVDDLDDFDFFRPFARKKKMQKDDYRLLAKRMMDRDLYWGDDYALEVLSTVLMRRIVVVRMRDWGQSSIAIKRPRVESGPPVVTMLRGEHYYAVSYAR